MKKLRTLTLVLVCSLTTLSQTPDRLAKFDPSGVPVDSVVTESAGKIGIHNLFPLGLLDIKATYAPNTDALQNLLSFTSPNGSSYSFVMNRAPSGNAADPDNDVMKQGWNCDGATPNEPRLCLIMERNFGVNPNNYEYHLEFRKATGETYRVVTGSVDRATGEHIVTTTGQSTFYSGNNHLQVGPAEILLQGSTRSQGDFIVSGGGTTAARFYAIGNQPYLQLGPNGGKTPVLAGNNALGGVEMFQANGMGNARIFPRSVNVRGEAGTSTVNTLDEFGLHLTGVNTRVNVNGLAGVTVSGSSCVITAIKGGIITSATCAP